MDRVNEIFNILGNIEYGFKNEDGKNIYNLDKERFERDFNSFYFLQTPKELLSSKCGVCYDFVELERALFQKSKIKCSTYFVFIDKKEYYPSHTFLVFEKNDKYYWFEVAWEKYKGIHEYNSLNQLLNDVVVNFKKEYSSKNFITYLYEYNKPQSHISCDEMYNFIESQKLIYKEL